MTNMSPIEDLNKALDMANTQNEHLSFVIKNPPIIQEVEDSLPSHIEEPSVHVSSPQLHLKQPILAQKYRKARPMTTKHRDDKANTMPQVTPNTS